MLGKLENFSINKELSSRNHILATLDKQRVNKCIINKVLQYVGNRILENYHGNLAKKSALFFLFQLTE